MFEMPPKPEIIQHNTYLREGESYMAVAKVIPLFNRNNEQKGFKIISLIKINPKKKEEKQEPKESLESFVEEDERI